MILNLPKVDHRLRFKAATEDIELFLPGTKACIVAFEDYREGEPPTRFTTVTDESGIDIEMDDSGLWTFGGYIKGPEQLDGPSLDVASTPWGKEILEILAAHGFEHIQTEQLH